MNRIQFSDRIYDLIRRLVQIVLPAATTLYASLATAWDWANSDKIVISMTAVTTFLGLALGVSKINYTNTGSAFDGAIEVYQDPERGVTANVDMTQAGDALLEKDQITLKVNRSFSRSLQDDS